MTTTSATSAIKALSRPAAIALTCLLGCVVLLVGVSAADAAPRSTVAVFGQSGVGEGQFSFVAGAAVNQDSGDVYVIDVWNERVQQFDADGVFIRAWGGNVADSAPDPPVHQVCTSGCLPGWAGSAEGVFSFGGQNAGIAVGPDGSVYVADAMNNRVQQFTAEGEFVAMWGWGVQTGTEALETCSSGCQAGIAGGGDGQLNNPIAVAVNPTDGDVVVADQYNGRVQRFDSAGAYEAQFAASFPQSVAVDSTGAVYTVDSGNLFKYAADGTPDPSFPVGANPFSVTVDPATDHVFVAQYFFNDVSGNYEGAEVREFTSDGTVVDSHLARSEVMDMYGVAVRSTTGRIYVSNTFEDRVFILDEPVHTATIEPSTDIGSRTATLNGSVSPGGPLSVGYHFEVSVDGETWIRFPDADVDAGAGTEPVAATAEATGLEPGRAYHVRLVATNQFGSAVISSGTAGDFMTDPEPPVVDTGPATQITSTSAALTGDIDTNNAETTYRFEWGNTADYGNSVPVPDASAGAAGTTVTVTERLNGLRPDTVYHYRLVASNVAGSDEGEGRTFRTRAAPASPAARRGYELVSPADKVGGVGVGHWYGGPDAVGAVGIAGHEGERFAVRGQQGSTITDDGAFGYVNDWVLAERTSAGWVHRPAVTRRAHAPQPTTDITLSRAAPDLSLTAWGSAQILKLFPEMAEWDANTIGSALLLRQWANPQWELFGPTAPSQDVPSGELGGNLSIANGPQAVAADGSAIVASSPGTRGLGGPGDPRDRPDLEAGAGSVYLDEITGTFSDLFPGDDGFRELVNVCTGSEDAGDRTVLPAGLCDPDETVPVRTPTLTHSGGAALSVGGVDPPASVISADGSRVFFMSPDPSLYQATSGTTSAQLFVRQRNPDGRVVTRWISQSDVENQDASLLGRTLFEGASRDGDKVFFRTTAPLTNDDPNGGCGAPCTSGSASTGSWDLYMYDLPDSPGADPVNGGLTRISRGPSGDSDCNVQNGALRWLSDGGSRAYFTCSTPMSGLVGSAEGTITTPGGTTFNDETSNLYLYDASTPRWTFVAQLPRNGAFNNCDTSSKGRGSTLGVTLGGTGNNIAVFGGTSCVRGTADGSLVTFMTDARLTGDDPDASTGDVYGYDTVRNELTRLSAAQGRPDAPRPCRPGHDVDVQCHADTGIGTGFMALEMLGVARRPGADGDRLAFFESRSQLVAEDSDASYDVYQWREGELTLLSPGVSDPDGAFYVGNDRTGTNVYLATRDQLTWQDTDRVLDVYTARVDGGIPEPEPTPQCQVLGSGCRAGGTGQVRSPVDSSRPGGRNAPGTVRTLSLGRLTRAQLRRAARTGRIRLRVRTNATGRVSVAARARLAGRMRVISTASKQVTRPGVTTVTLRLSSRARAALASGRALRVTLRASQRGTKSRRMNVRLKRSSR